MPKIEQRLPAHSAIAASLRFRPGYRPDPDRIHHFLAQRGFSIPQDSLSVVYDGEHFELQCLIFAGSVAHIGLLSQIVLDLKELPEIERFNVAPSRRA